jgi:hypothetical protein
VLELKSMPSGAVRSERSTDLGVFRGPCPTLPVGRNRSDAKIMRKAAPFVMRCCSEGHRATDDS